MHTPTHLFAGYLALKATQSIWFIQDQNFDLLLFIGLGLSVAIDLDVIFSKGIRDHHKQLTHYPVFWLGISAIIFLLAVFSNNIWLESLAFIVLLTSHKHLFLDLFGVTMGIHWFWPLSRKEFSFTKLRPQTSSEKVRWSYVWQNKQLVLFEMIIITVGITTLIIDFLT